LGTLVVLKMLIPNPNFPEIMEPRGEVKLFEHFQFNQNHTVHVLPSGNTSTTLVSRVKWIPERSLAENSSLDIS
jgi:hypothetical protein